MTQTGFSFGLAGSRHQVRTSDRLGVMASRWPASGLYLQSVSERADPCDYMYVDSQLSFLKLLECVHDLLMDIKKHSLSHL